MLERVVDCSTDLDGFFSFVLLVGLFLGEYINIYLRKVKHRVSTHAQCFIFTTLYGGLFKKSNYRFQTFQYRSRQSSSSNRDSNLELKMIIGDKIL